MCPSRPVFKSESGFKSHAKMHRVCFFLVFFLFLIFVEGNYCLLCISVTIHLCFVSLNNLLGVCFSRNHSLWSRIGDGVGT
jgi:hypothetical protein